MKQRTLAEASAYLEGFKSGVHTARELPDEVVQAVMAILEETLEDIKENPNG